MLDPERCSGIGHKGFNFVHGGQAVILLEMISVLIQFTSGKSVLNPRLLTQPLIFDVRQIGFSLCPRITAKTGKTSLDLLKTLRNVKRLCSSICNAR